MSCETNTKVADDVENNVSEIVGSLDEITSEALTERSGTVSKRQRKKLEKRRLWVEQKPLRKAKEKEKRKLKIQLAKESGRDLGPSRKLLKASKMCESSCQLRVCFDMSLAELMTEAEFSKAMKQLNRCYALNRRAQAPLQLYITGYSDATKYEMGKKSGCFNWDVNLDQSSHAEVFGKENTVYLTSDSPNVLDKLEHSKAYIIGALVDHNRLKNVSYESAEEAGIGHARFPLDLYFKFQTRKVLTIDQVYLILLRLTEGKSWIDAVMKTVPKRKGVEPCLDETAQEETAFSDIDEKDA